MSSFFILIHQNQIYANDSTRTRSCTYTHISTIFWAHTHRDGDEGVGGGKRGVASVHIHIERHNTVFSPLKGRRRGGGRRSLKVGSMRVAVVLVLLR